MVAPSSSGHQSSFVPTHTPILHVALEYTLPHVAPSLLMYGGMGLVVDTFLKVSCLHPVFVGQN